MEFDLFQEAVARARTRVNCDFENAHNRLINEADSIAQNRGKTAITRWYQNYWLDTLAFDFERASELQDLFRRTINITRTPNTMMFFDKSNCIKVNDVLDSGRAYQINKISVCDKKGIEKLDNTIGTLYLLIKNEEHYLAKLA